MAMNVSMNIHRVTDVSVVHRPEISNALSMIFQTDDGAFELTAFDIPTAITDKILAALPAVTYADAITKTELWHG